MTLLTPTAWRDYELVDTGDGEKLERFGAYTLRRPEPQAVWRKTLPEPEWTRLANATFRRESDRQRESEKGEWVLKPGMPDRWTIDYQWTDLHIRMRLGLTAFKQVGVFPEQAENWNYIYQAVRDSKAAPPRV